MVTTSNPPSNNNLFRLDGAAAIAGTLLIFGGYTVPVLLTISLFNPALKLLSDTTYYSSTLAAVVWIVWGGSICSARHQHEMVL
jgi:hypothetical protein